MKKFLIIVVSLVLLFLNIPVIANAASDLTQPTITLSETKVKSGDTIKFEIEANDKLAVLEDSPNNVILIRSRVDGATASYLHPNYNGSTGKYELEYTISSNMLKGEWYIDKVVLQANAENRTYYYSNITFTVDSIVSFNSNGGSQVADLPVEYNGKAIAPSELTNPGYTFGGWYKDNTSFSNIFDFTNTAITENITLFAKWIINSYTVTFDSQGGSEVTSNTADYNNLIATPATPTKTGYKFDGWYKETECLNTWNFIADKVTENTILYAKWTDATLKIPTGLTAVSTGYSSINISWGTITGASGYEIYKATSSAGAYTLISDLTETKYINSGLITDSTYYYKVRGYRMVDNVKVYSDYSTAVSAKPILAKPINANATRSSSKGIKLTWSSVTGASGYEISKATSITGTYNLLTRTVYLYYTNQGLITGKTYYYKIRSYRTIGKISVYSNWIVATNRLITIIVFNNIVQSNSVNGKYAGLKVEIKDQSKSTFLIKKSNGTQMWVASKSVSINANPVTNTKYLDKKQLETYVNITSNFVSNTSYFTWVDLNRQRVSVFNGSAGCWVLLKTYSCASGNNVTPSKRGLFTVQDKGYSFVAGSGVLVKYWTRYSGNYLLHSTLLTASGKVYDGTVGKRASHGCIRMPLDMAKWYYEKIPKGSLIWVN